MITDKRLLPCPFCGVVPEIAICDDEGNMHDEEYAKNPWSGLGYKIIHHVEQPGAENCPIASYDDGFDGLGTQLYDSIDELIQVWNSRIDDTDDDDDAAIREYLSGLSEREVVDSVCKIGIDRCRFTPEEIAELKKKYVCHEE